MQDVRILWDPDPFVRVWELGASSVDIMCRVWVKNPEYFEIRCACLSRVKKALEKEGINIPSPQLDVHMHSK